MAAQFRFTLTAQMSPMLTIGSETLFFAVWRQGKSAVFCLPAIVRPDRIDGLGRVLICELSTRIAIAAIRQRFPASAFAVSVAAHQRA